MVEAANPAALRVEYAANEARIAELKIRQAEIRGILRINGKNRQISPLTVAGAVLGMAAFAATVYFYRERIAEIIAGKISGIIISRWFGL